MTIVKHDDYYRGDRSDFLEWVGGSPRRVLDIGCGAGAAAPWFRSHGAAWITGVEIEVESAREASLRYDEVFCRPIEDVIDDATGPYDLIVCADILEHLVDPWALVRRLRRLSSPDTVLALSVPNIGYLPALARIAFGRGFQYEERGIFDQTHLRFFTRGNVVDLLKVAAWSPIRMGCPSPRRFLRARNGIRRATGGRSDRWLASQVYVSARPSGG